MTIDLGDDPDGDIEGYDGAITPIVHIVGAGGWRACDTHADWHGTNTDGVTCHDCLAAAGAE